MLKLRPHHIQCLFFYRGMGYSEAFVERMSRLEKELILYPYTEMKFVIGCDVLCECCPHKQEDQICSSEEKVQKLDRDTLAHYGLEEYKVYNFQFIKEHIYKHFDSKQFTSICSSCEWYKQGVCSIEYIQIQKQKFNPYIF